MRLRPAKTFRFQLFILWSLWASLFVVTGYVISQFRHDEIVDLISKPVVWLVVGTFAPACISLLSRLLRMTRVLWKGRGFVESNQPTIVLLRPFNRDPELQTKVVSEPALAFANRFPTDKIQFKSTYFFHFDLLVDIVYAIVSMTLDLLGILAKIVYNIVHYDTFESLLERSLKTRTSPLLALGNPSDRLPPRGATRVYPSDDGWRDVVISICGNAKCILLLAGDTPGIVWELDYLRKHVDPRKIFVLIEPRPTPSQRQDWAALLRIFAEAGWAFPKAHPGFGSVIGFKADWTPTICGRSLGSAASIARVINSRMRLAESSRAGSSESRARLELDLAEWNSLLLVRPFSGGMSGILLVSVAAFASILSSQVFYSCVYALVPHNALELIKESSIIDTNILFFMLIITIIDVTTMALPCVAVGLLFFYLYFTVFSKLYYLEHRVWKGIK